MTDLERALRDLDPGWPPTPDLASAVAARLAGPEGARPRRTTHAPAGRLRFLPRGAWRARVAWAAAALVLAAGITAAASPDARSTVLRWLGLESVEIKRAPLPPGLARDLDLGAAVALPRDARVPEALGEPDGVFATHLPDGTTTPSLLYAGPPRILVQVFEARATPFIEKTVGSGAQVERLTVDGAPAYWITGEHGFAFESPNGVGFEQQRLAGSTLLVERDGLLIRVEGEIPRARAVEIASGVSPR